MAKAAKPKLAAKPKNKKEQYERFQQTARQLGVDNDQAAETFDGAFEKIVPPRRAPKASS